MADSGLVRRASWKDRLHKLRRIFPAVNQAHPGYCPYTAVWYANSSLGSDTNIGYSPMNPFKSLDRAIDAATAFAAPHQCIVLEPSGTAYHDDTGEVFPCVVSADLDDLTIMSASAVPGTARHTVIGATDENSASGLLYSLAENTKLINLCFLSNKTPVYLGTESGHAAGEAVTVGALVQGCVFDTGATASQPALSLSCTNAVIDGCEIVANGATSDGIKAYDPFTIKNSVIQAAVDGIHIAGGATYNTRIDNNVFEAKPDTTACSGYWINVAVGSNDIIVTRNLFAPDAQGDATGSIGEDDDVFAGRIVINLNYGVTATINPGGGAGDKTGTTTAVAVVVAY